MNKTIQEILQNSQFDYEKEFENIIFDYDRLYDLLNSGKRIKKADREILQDALNILWGVYKL